MSWLYVPGLEDLNSESASLSTISERAAASSLQWRGKPLLPAAWSRQWKRGGFITRLSGLICSPSMLGHGAASFISSLRAIPARTTALPESALGPMATASLPPRSAALPKSAGLILSSERTSRGTRPDSSLPSARLFGDWATALRQEYSARPKPAIPCGASDCSSWPSARAEDAESSGRRQGRDISDTLTAAARDAVENWPAPKVERGGYQVQRDGSLTPTLEGAAAEWMAPVADDTGMRTKKYGQGGTALSMQAGDWMAPQVPNGGRSTAHAEQVGATMYHNGKKVQMGLESQAKDWAAPRTSDTNGAGHHGDGGIDLRTQASEWNPENWPALATRDHKGSSEGSMTRQDGKTRADMLDFAAEQFFTLPPSSPAPLTDAGPICSTDSPNTNQPSVRRKLNPIFVEALIRWPTGLSGFARPETAWTRWWQLMPSYLSALCSQGSEGPEQGSLF